MKSRKNRLARRMSRCQKTADTLVSDVFGFLVPDQMHRRADAAGAPKEPGCRN